MEVIFEKPLNGWIKVDINISEKYFSDSLSYTPEDFIYKLLEVLNLISSLEGKYSLKCYSEPVIYDFIFETKGNDLSFEISYQEKENYKHLFNRTDSKDKILFTFYKALSKMKSNISDDDYESNWHIEFPEEKFQKLKSYLTQNKKTV